MQSEKTRLRHFFLLLFLFQIVISFGKTAWTSSSFGQKAFIENKGQFDGQNGKSDSRVVYGASCEGVDLYFTSEGLTYRHVEYPVFSHEEREEIEKGNGNDLLPALPVRQYLHITWEGANPDVKIIAEEKVSYYHTYPNPVDPTGSSCLKASAYKKIIYKNLYPNIDLEYIFPEGKGGVKYSLILHPGADPSRIKMKYAGAKKMSLDVSGNVVIQSSFGEFTDHAPQTFYAKSKKPIASSFLLRDNEVSFSLPSSLLKDDQEEPVIIDPWTTNPAFPGFNSAYDVEYDFAGNVYAYGGACPYILVKMNNAGAIQWVYTATAFTFAGYYGDFCVDPNSGSSYVCEGAYFPWTGAHVAKVNASGAQVAMFPGGNALMKECWRVIFDNCNKKIIIGGSSFNNPAPAYAQGYILDTNCTAITAVNLLAGTTFFLNEQDIALLAMDSSGNCFFGNTGNKFLKVPAATLAPSTYVLPNAHTFTELGSIAYVRNTNPSTCGMNGMAVSNKYLYTYDGGLLQRWNKNTGALMNSTTLSATKFRWGGVAVDVCDNIFVGTPTGVTQYDTAFAVVAAFPSDTVYDVRLAPGNLMYACGRAFVASYQLNLQSCNTTFTVTASAIGSCTNQGSAAAFVSGGTAPYTYSWNPSGQITPTATGLLAGTYTVTVTDNTFCFPKTQTATVAVTSIGSNLSITASQNDPLCNGSPTGMASVTTIGGTGPFTYMWSPSGGSSSAASGLVAGTYTALVTDATGCQILQIITLTQPAAMAVTVNSTSTTCTSNSGTATANASGGSPGYTYLWTNGQSTSAISGLAAGNYSVTVTDANGCILVQVVVVSSGGGVAVSVTSTQTDCAVNNGTATANPTGGTAPYAYNWSNGQTSQTATGLAVGNYSVTVSDAGGCIQTQVVSITEPPGPTATVSGSSSVVAVGASSTLAATGAGSYQWSPVTGLNCTTCTSPVATPAQTTEYCVTITDANGCSDSACFTIYVDIPCGVIYIPNAFSPNNDQENDLECVMGACIEEMHFTIFNRWGELVFESRDQKICWDGTDGRDVLGTAVFTYYLEATLKGGKIISQKGNISLIR